MTQGYTVPDHNTLPPNCQACKAYLTCQTYKIPGRHDTREDHRDKPLVMIVGQSPGKNEDFKGKIFIGPSGEFLQKFLDGLEVQWYLTNAFKCYQGIDPVKGGDRKLTAKEVEYCNEFLRQEILEYKPRVIVCLGEIAIRAVLGKGAPRTVKEASSNVYDLDGIKVLSNYHPVNDVSVTWRDNGKELTDPYIAMFTRAEQEAMGTYVEETIPYTVVTDPLFKLPKVNLKRVMDIEDTHWDDDPFRKTMFHPGSEMACWSLCYKDGDEYKTYVYIDGGKTKENMEDCLAGAVIGGHNLKHDFLGTKVFLGIDPFEIMEDWFDTFLFWFLQDQSKFGNGLKDLCMKYFGCEDWSKKVWNEVKRIIKQKKDTNIEIRKINKQRLKEDPDAVLLEEILEVANIGDIPRDMLIEYSAKDAYWNCRLLEEIVPTLPPIRQTLWDMNKRATRALMRIEYHGLPFDSKRLRSVAEVARKKMAEVFRLIHNQPEVQAVLDGWCEQDGENVIMHAPEAFNPKGWKYLESLARRMDHHTWETTTPESPRLSFNKMTWRILIGKDGERSREEWIWYYHYAYRQLVHLEGVFIKGLLEYIVDNRVHTTYKMGKSESSIDPIGGDVSGGIESGRIGSSNPNLLNLKKDKLLRSGIRVVT